MSLSSHSQQHGHVWEPEGRRGRPLDEARRDDQREDQYEYSKEEDLIKHEGKLCEKKCDGWNGQQDSWAKRRLGHNYQTEKDALEYYRLEMKNNCDNKC